MESSKRQIDLQKGMDLRSQVYFEVNQKLPGVLQFYPAFEKYGGLTYSFFHAGSGKELPVMIRFSTDSGFYIKIPKEWMHLEYPAEKYLDYIKHFYVLFVLKRRDSIFQKYSLNTLESIIQNKQYWREESEGNKNRIQFDYAPGALTYSELDEGGILGDSIINTLLQILA